MSEPKYYFHGSKKDIQGEYLNPMPSKTIDGESAVYATTLKGFAIHFIAQAKDINIESGVYKGQPYVIEQYPGAFDTFYKGVSGYIYYVDPSGFQNDTRLGLQNYEYIQKSPVKILKKEYISDVYQALVNSGDIRVVSWKEAMNAIFAK